MFNFFSRGKSEKLLTEMRRRLSDNISALSAERGRLTIVLSSMSEAVIAVDNNGRLTFANPAAERIFNFLEPQVLGKTPRESLFNNEIADLFSRALASGGKISAEITTITPLQGVFLAQAGPILGNKGEILGVVTVLHDITELKKLENYRTEFIANVSHELKTPLTAIRSFVETLLGGAINDQKHNRDFLRKIDKHAGNLSALIDDILTLSRLETKRERIPFSPVDLKQILRRAIETVQEKAHKKNVRIEKMCRGENFTILGIEDHLYHAFLNLLDNALNYTDAGGKISINCEFLSDAVKITISDTGIGISAEHLPRLFERFYRVDKARARDLGGTGLGLAIVKHVMNLHNGSVAVTSTPGRGSEFTLDFPLANR
ncbi:PAS domain-containing protein [Candidatus Saganbacteria bacterium]|nr:PAS domain-containing protein [Candidatus Saganbacteria bacterium]